MKILTCCVSYSEWHLELFNNNLSSLEEGGVYITVMDQAAETWVTDFQFLAIIFLSFLSVNKVILITVWNFYISVFSKQLSCVHKCIGHEILSSLAVQSTKYILFLTEKRPNHENWILFFFLFRLPKTALSGFEIWRN